MIACWVEGCAQPVAARYIHRNHYATPGSSMEHVPCFRFACAEHLDMRDENFPNPPQPFDADVEAQQAIDRELKEWDRQYVRGSE